MNENDLLEKEILAKALQDHKKNNYKSAEKLYKEVLKKNPNNINAIIPLGALLGQSKKLEEAKKLFQKAISINPNNSKVHYNLGLVFKEKNEYLKAISCYEEAIKIDPNYSKPHNNLGVIFYELHEFKKSRDCYEKAIQINPNFSQAHFNLGNLYEELFEYEKALSCYEQAIKINPISANYYFNLGNLYEDLGRYAKAIESYKKAIEFKPDYIDAYNNLALVLKQIGKIQEAISLYEKIIKLKFDNLISIYYLSQLKKEILDKNLEKKIIKIIKQDNCTKENYTYGNFLLSKYEFAKRNYKNEFNHLAKGHLNYLKLKGISLSNEIDYWLNKLPNMKELFDLKKIEENSDNNFFKINPIFIIGIPRSGSTLIEKIIASGRKQIPIGEETNIFRNFVKQLVNNNSLTKLDIKVARTQIIEKYKSKGLIEKENDNMFTDKSLDNFFYIGLVKKIFPNAKFIHCQRHSLSSIMSIFKNIYKDIPWGHNLEHIFQYIDNYKKIVKNFYGDFIYDLQYEVFVKNPELQSKKLLEFCNIPWDIKCLEFYKRKDIISKTASAFQIKKAIYQDSGEKYLQYKDFLYKYKKKYTWFN